MDNINNFLQETPTNILVVDYLNYYQGLDKKSREDIKLSGIPLTEQEYKPKLKAYVKTFFKQIMDPRTPLDTIADMIEEEYFKFGFEEAPFVTHKTFN